MNWVARQGDRGCFQMGCVLMPHRQQGWLGKAEKQRTENGCAKQRPGGQGVLTALLPSFPIHPEKRGNSPAWPPLLPAITRIICSVGLSSLCPPQWPQREEGQDLLQLRRQRSGGCAPEGVFILISLHLFGPRTLNQFTRALCPADNEEALCLPLPSPCARFPWKYPGKEECLGHQRIWVSPCPLTLIPSNCTQNLSYS